MEWHSFQPTRLARAREVVVAAHPGTATAPAPLPAEALPALRRRVAAAQGDKVALDSLALAINPREVRALVTGLEQWEELRAATAFLLRARLRPDLLGALWRAWQRLPKLAELKQLIEQAAAAFGWGAAVGPSYSDVAPAWVSAAEPGVAIQRWLDGLGLGYSDCLLLAESPLMPDTPLLRLVRDAVMTHGSAAQLRVEGPERLHVWREELSPANRVLFGRNYLVRVPAAHWYRPILDWIEQSYGVPRRPRIPSFWEGVPEPIKLAFQRIFIEKWIGEVFQNDSDRRNYWHRWADQMEYVQRGEVGRTEYGVMDFGPFGVIEFFEYGHAAYFYPEHILKEAGRRTIRTPKDLRSLWMYKYSGGLGEYERLIHRRGWYDNADQMVASWIGRARKSSAR
jgi:hypothetical protein